MSRIPLAVRRFQSFGNFSSNRRSLNGDFQSFGNFLSNQRSLNGDFRKDLATL